MSEQKPTKNKDYTAEIILVLIGFFIILLAVASWPTVGSGKAGEQEAIMFVYICAPIGVIAIIVGIAGIYKKWKYSKHNEE